MSAQEDYCVICYEPGEFVKSQPCECKGTLQFHTKCLGELKKHTHVCPTCKTEFKLPDGPVVLKMSDDETIHVTIKNGKWHGPAHLFNKAGIREFTDFYEHGKNTGRINVYHTNGIISIAETVHKFRRVGPYIRYYKNGVVKDMGYYKNHKLLYYYSYAKNGTLIEYLRMQKGEKCYEYWIHPLLQLKNIMHDIRHEIYHLKYTLFNPIKNYFGFA